MGTKRVELLQCDEPIAPAQLLDMQNNANQHVNNVIQDLLGSGVFSATLAPMSSGIGVTISGFECYSSTGHGKQTAEYDVSLASNVPTSGYRWVSIFATPGWTEGDYRADYYGDSDYHNRTETVTFSVVNGTSTTLPSNPGGGAVRVCSVRLHSSTTSISSSMIKTNLSNSDHQYPLTSMLRKAGGTLTGTVAYNGRPLAQMNSGKFKFPASPELISGTGDSDWDGHYILSSGGWIDSKIVSENLAVQLIPVIGFYQPDGTIAAARVQLVTMRMHTDLMAAGETLTEGLFVIYEEDASNENTGRFLVVCVGAAHYVNRFAGRTVRWTAVAPQPNGLEA